MLFHLGALLRLNQAGVLVRISSVSGGSIISAVLGLNWAGLETDEPSRAGRFRRAPARVADVRDRSIVH
jgi:NTE family protein